MAKDVGNKGVQSSNMGCTVCVPDKRINSLQPEAAQCLLNYFRRLQVEDLSFFYAVQLDSNGFTTNFFWRDGRSKVDYDYFGDVLILDKTFRIEEHNIICAPLWGLNHHRQQVLFGCAFLLNESTDSFVWLLETFMEAMDRHQPKTIFTDENELMVDAVKAVLPDAEHRIGIWYIRQNALKQLSALYMQPGFEILFNKCISDCQTEEEFESRWESLLERFDLSENPWLSRLQHGENIKSVFQIPKNENMGLLEFAQQYLEEVKRRRLEELDEDFQCNGTAQVTILTSSAIERQAADIYTRTLFKTFQEEFLKCLSVTIEETASNETITTYKLTEEGQKESVVEFNCLDSRVACSCKKFESFGILCFHALKVLNARNIFHIPHKYVLKRWTKSAKCGVPYEYEQEMADEMKQQTVNLLMHKTLNVFTKSVAIEDSKKIAGDCLGKTLEQIEDVLRAKKADHLEMIDMSRGMI
ncbi:protein FAR1-RELATED SEQUENCE 5 [Populus alba]|uniref:protein FAR1-RELATED SEQUENCE 5 n=1 Tax=Populus alba TaxID=43335 RepID=UPI003CC766D7